MLLVIKIACRILNTTSNGKYLSISVNCQNIDSDYFSTILIVIIKMNAKRNRFNVKQNSKKSDDIESGEATMEKHLSSENESKVDILHS